MTKQWFEVDKKGLAQLVERRGKAFVITELIQNAWDETVTNVEVSFSKRQSDNKWCVTVIDDSPNGFSDLRDAFTLFAPSKKKNNPAKRGRFNLGEKLVLALASEASIISTRGSISFDAEGRHTGRNKRPHGTCFAAVFPSFTNKDVDEALALCKRLIPPYGVKTRVSVNGKDWDRSFYIEQRNPLHVIDVILPTEIENDEGKLIRTQRRTSVEIYRADDTLVPAIYELGIPVVETDDQFVVNVNQKVPLNFERDNVTPSYLRSIRTFVLNHTSQFIKGEDTTATWVAEAIADERVAPEVVQKVITERFGKKVVAYDPSDPEANALATSKGYTVVGGRTFSKEQWANIRKAGVVQPAGQVTPSPKVLSSPDGIPPLDPSKWTDEHHVIADYAKRVHRALVGSGCQVDFMHERTQGNGGFNAWYGGSHLTINISKLGKAWLKEVTQEDLDRLLIHEYGHAYEANHLSEGYHDALCVLGARLRRYSEEIGTLR